ncbi:MAG: LemA family protein [candidate division TA06 bacterium 32_111]|uniref:LemA family protein n=2 Tax=Bacteria candidate phyla TaxID=1783234 RepID=A0A124G0N8_UNCT6|nr:MAG: LemA family protein [candidate division TA06 bacterium 32_111]KUK88076.1 MAG: LemA family protein [candidate division TA06 bacterium 34_109]
MEIMYRGNSILGSNPSLSELLKRGGKMVILIVVGIILLVIILAVIGIYNNLVRERNRVKNAWSQIDVQLKRRYDLIPNLVEVVKDYMSYEQETLTKVIEARNFAMNAKGVKAQAEAENMLSGALKSLFAVVENYPDLKANENVMRLQEELTSTENRISYARQFYNDSVMQFNTMVETFPANIVAAIFNFKQMEFFIIPESEKANVKVDLR